MLIAIVTNGAVSVVPCTGAPNGSAAAPQVARAVPGVDEAGERDLLEQRRARDHAIAALLPEASPHGADAAPGADDRHRGEGRGPLSGYFTTTVWDMLVGCTRQVSRYVPGTSGVTL